MNRLQKKCLIATASGHLLLLLILLVGPGFFTSKSKPDDTELLDVIPSTLVDAAFSSGVKDAQAPPLNPTPMVQPPSVQPPTPTPPQPPQPPSKPVVQPPEPKPEPVKQPDAEPAKDVDKTTPDGLEPVAKPVKSKPHEVKVDLTAKVTRKVPKRTAADDRAAEKAAEIAEDNAARAAADKRAKSMAKVFSGATSYINGHSSSSTSVEMPGNGSVSYASYASAVKSIYEHAWASFDDAAIDHDVVTTVSVTIARDGRVLSSHIVDRSGDAQVDTSVRRTLDSVDFVAPFPEGATEKERTFTIKFDHKAKRMLG